MIADPLAQILLLLASAVGVVALARRVGLPAILGYLFVGIAMGPYALGLVDETEGTKLLAELGVVFLLFTLGLEFSWPRMVAMRREVFGVGSVQMLLVAGCASLAFHAFGVDLLAAVALGGAVAVSSTAILVQQLTEQSEINRTHGRVAFSVLLFQDLAFVPFLVLAGALAAGSLDFSAARIGTAVAVEVRPDSGSRSATNPGYNATMLVAEYNPVGNAVGELATATARFVPGGASPTLLRSVS